ncbi:MAG: hypothetical protein KF823_08280 [Xanthomonadales bacterium]|nr:hypothetical protein [Xanthomonadales bacterium]
MNRLQGTCVGLVALLGAAVLPVAADPALDTWHGGSVDVIIAEPGPALAGMVEYDEDMAGVLPNTGWVNVFGYELRGRISPYAYTTSATTGAHWCTGSERFADSRIELPHNANITFFRMWGFDNSADHDVAAFLFESCLPNLSAGNLVNTVLQEITSTGTPGAFTVTSEPNAGPTNLETCTYHVRVRFGVGCGGAGQTTLRKLRVQYTLAP